MKFWKFGRSFRSMVSFHPTPSFPTGLSYYLLERVPSVMRLPNKSRTGRDEHLNVFDAMMAMGFPLFPCFGLWGRYLIIWAFQQAAMGSWRKGTPQQSRRHERRMEKFLI